MRKSGEKILVTKSYLPPLEEYKLYLDKIWESRWLTNMGELHEMLRTRLADYMGVQGIELFTNGHLALEMIIQAMNLTGEVITTPYTFASTTHAIVRNGLTPVFCDIDPKTCTIDTSKIENLITDRTSAIIPVHVYGQICDIEKIDRIARKYDLKVIYDAAHTFGETYKGVGIGNYGDASMFSFHATKVFHTIEGGAVTYSDPKLSGLLYQLKNFGILDKETVAYVGGNAKMSEFQAAMGLCNLNHMAEVLGARKELAQRYRCLLSNHDGIHMLGENSEVEYNYAYMPIFFDGPYNRDKVYDILADKNIFARKYFYPCVDEYECYKNDYAIYDTSVAHRMSKQVLTLPLYAELDPEVVDEICEIILSTK